MKYPGIQNLSDSDIRFLILDTYRGKDTLTEEDEIFLQELRKELRYREEQVPLRSGAVIMQTYHVDVQISHESFRENALVGNYAYLIKNDEIRRFSYFDSFATQDMPWKWARK